MLRPEQYPVILKIMNAVLSSPLDLFKILVAHNCDWSQRHPIWKSREHYYDGLQYLIKEIGLKHQNFLWYSYIAVIHTVMNDSQEEQKVNLVLVNEMIKLIEAHEQHLMGELTLLGELILMLIEKMRFDSSNVSIGFPLQDNIVVDHILLVASDEQCLRLLDFFIQVTSLLLVKKRPLSNNFVEFILEFAIGMCQFVGDLDLSPATMTAFLQIVLCTVQPSCCTLMMDGILNWIENQSLSSNESRKNLCELENVWIAIRIVVLQLVTRANGDFFLVGCEKRLSSVIDYCIFQAFQNSKPFICSEIQQKVVLTLSGALSILSIILPHLPCSAMEISQAANWCMNSATCPLWSLRIFAQVLQKKVDGKFQKELCHLLGMDPNHEIRTTSAGQRNSNGGGPAHKRPKSENSAGFPSVDPSINLKVSHLSLVMSTLLNQTENLFESVDPRAYSAKISLCLVTFALLGISPKSVSLPRNDGTNNWLLDAYICTLLVVSDQLVFAGVASSQWIRDLHGLFAPFCDDLGNLRVEGLLPKFYSQMDANHQMSALSSYSLHRRLMVHYSAFKFAFLHHNASLATLAAPLPWVKENEVHNLASEILDHLCISELQEYANNEVLETHLVHHCKCFFAGNDRWTTLPILVKLNKYLELRMLRNLNIALNTLSLHTQKIVTEVISENASILLDASVNAMLGIEYCKKSKHFRHNSYSPRAAGNICEVDNFTNSLWLWQIIEDLLRSILGILADKDDGDSESLSLVVDHSEKTSFVLLGLKVITNYLMLVEIVQGCDTMSETHRQRLGLIQEVVLFLVQSPSKQINLLSAVARLSSIVMLQTIWSRPRSSTTMTQAIDNIKSLPFIESFMSKINNFGGVDVNAILLTKSLSLAAAISCFVDSPTTIWASCEICKVLASPCRRTPMMVSQNVVEHFSKILRFSQVFKPYPAQIMELVVFPLFTQQTVGNRTCFAMIDKLFRSGNSPFLVQFSGITVAQLVARPKVEVKAILNTVTSNKIGFPLTKEYLLDEWSHMLYHLLLSDSIFQSTFADVVGEKLSQLFEQSCQLFGVKLHLRGDGDILSEKVLNQLIIQLVWSLGSKGEISCRAIKGLQIICYLYYHKTWSKDVRDIRSVEKDVLMATSFVLSKCFLFLFSYLLQQNWSAQKSCHQIKSLISLRHLIEMLEDDAVAKFLPKIWNIIEISLQSHVKEVKLISIEVAEMLCDHLPRDVLKDNLIIMSAGLCSMFIDRPPLKFDCNHITPSTAEQLTNALPTPIENIGPGVFMTELIESSFYLDKQEELHQCVKEKCINLISKLLKSNISDSTIAVSVIAAGGVPDGELHELKAQHHEVIRKLSLDRLFSELHSLLKHESLQVRTIALKLCWYILKERKENLYELLNISMNNATVGVMDSSITLLVKDLLELTTRETDATILQQAGRCLGEMGSISPSLINLDTLETTRKFSQKDFHNPLSLTLLDFSLHILQVYIVMGFKGASSVVAQDQSSYAIQEILQILKNNQPITNSQCIPEDVRKELSSRGVLDIVEPFWASKYKIKDLSIKYKTPLYRVGMEYARWIYLLCRYLISEAKGPLNAIFDACRGVIRHRLDLCQYLLPYLILNVSIHPGMDVVYQAVMNEFALVLSFSKGKDDGTTEVDNFNHLCVQTIFNVLDIFEDWKSSLLDPANQLPASSDIFGTKKDIIAALEKTAVKISLHQLSEAAMVTKSFTRAMRYIEMESREIHRAKRGQSPDDPNLPVGRAGASGTSIFSITSILKRRDDKAGGELPILTLEQINCLGTIYGELEDIDALSGIQILRRVNGYTESLKHKVMELTQSDDWLGALLEYELIQNSPVYVQALADSFSVSYQPGSASKICSATPKQSRTSNGRLLQRKESLYRNPYPICDVPVNVWHRQKNQIDNCHFSPREICDIEKGKLRCLLELGHLESVIHQSSGRSALSEDLQRSLTPIGLEASWRLMKWDDADFFVDVAKANRLDFSVNLTEAEDFRLRVGKALVFMNKSDTTAFHEEIGEARQQAVMGLAAAGMESYGKAYPALLRLHMLQELETGFELLSLNSANARSKADDSNHVMHDEVIHGWRWDNRLKFMSDSMAHRSQLLAIRRAVLGMLHLHDKVAANWMGLSNELRHMGRYDSARIALRNAISYGIDEDVALIEDCRLLREQGQCQKALLLLEPSEIDLTAIHNGLKVRRKANIPSFLDSEEKRKTLAERIHLATQIMVELQQSQAAHIIDRYETVLALNKKWDQAYYDCGKYFEFLFSEAMEKDLQLQQSNAGSSTSSKANSHVPNADSRTYYMYVEEAIEKYGNCLRLKGDTILQVLPKILTLWFSYTELRNNGVSTAGSSSTAASSTPLQVSQGKVNDHMQRLAQDVGPNIWFHALQQIVSRVGHKNFDTVAIIETLLLKVLTAYPKQGIWHIAHLMYSLNKDRREIAKKVLRETHRLIKSDHPDCGKMLVESQHLFQNLSNLAALNCNQRRITWQMDKKIQLDLFLVPTQSILLHCDSSTGWLPSTVASGIGSGNGFMHIQKFGEYIDVASSKAKPKTIRFETTCGKSLKFLCKQEKDGDLRKDVRMMEFNNTVNKLFQHDAQGGRQRNLRLRTYAVVCLNEECGILEWVNNTECLRHLITQAHSTPHNPTWSELYPMLYVKDIYLVMKEYQEKYEDDLVMMIKCYQELVEKYKPCFHKWFLDRFKDATAWYEARQLYTRSVAVWSGVGHVIGLGDRHTENILLDITNGECVQVDFDCLFDKGLTLLRPEIIPFRLTQNMVDAMGVCGVEGTFRKTLELTLKVLRENKEILLNVLEPFLRDPTVAWSRAGRAQKNDQNAHSKQQMASEDQVNNEATEMMKRIAARLSGEYYFLHPGREKLIRGAKSRNQPVPSKGIGPSREELMPLSVPGQAQKLIDEATAIENLAQLYYGWQAWL